MNGAGPWRSAYHGAFLADERGNFPGRALGFVVLLAIPAIFLAVLSPFFPYIAARRLGNWQPSRRQRYRTLANSASRIWVVGVLGLIAGPVGVFWLFGVAAAGLVWSTRRYRDLSTSDLVTVYLAPLVGVVIFLAFVLAATVVVTMTSSP